MAETTPRVLVVDDERFFREAIQETLGAAGIDCEAVASGEEGLAAARDSRVGVVVLDVSLRDISGIEVLRRLRAARPALRVIVLSDHTDQGLVLEALRLDASDYLAKPLHDEELVLAVRRALAGYDVESSWQRLRERLRRLEVQLAALADHAREAPSPDRVDAFAAAAAEAVGRVLDAGKTSLMLLDPESQLLRVAAATGSPVAAGEMDPVALGEGVAGVAAELGEAISVDDVYTDDRFAGRTLRDRYESASLAVAPLLGDAGPLGVLCATDRPGAAPFGPDELALLKLLAAPLSGFLAAIRRAPGPGAGPRPAPASPLGDAAPTREADPDAEMAREICEAVTLEIEPERVLAGALRPVARRLPAGVVALHLIDQPTGELVRQGQVDDLGSGDRERLPRSRGLTAAVLQSGGLVATNHPERDPRFDPEVDTAADGKLRPLLCVPLRLRGKVLGVFRGFPESGVGVSARTGEILAATLSAAVRNVLLYRSLLESIDEIADARREAGDGPGAGR